MKNSTILVVGTLGLVGAYLYLKGKKEPMLEEVVDNSLESIPTTPTTPTIIPIAPPTTTIAPIAPIVPKIYIITPPTTPTTGTIGKSVLSPLVDATLGLSPKPIIETETENYIKSKALSKGVQVLFQQMQNLQNELRNTMPSGFLGMFKKPSTDNREVIVAKINDDGKQMSENTAQAIALGYKILPLGEIEKLQII